MPIFCQDLAHEIHRVKDFLEVDLSEDIVQKIVHKATFEIMKENPMANYETVPSSIFDKSKSSFMRKGKIKNPK